MPIVFIATLIFMQVLLVFIHLAVYGTLAAAFGIGGIWVKTLFIILAFSFTAGSLIAFRFRNNLVTWLYAFAAYWFGLAFFLFMGGVAWFVVENIFNYYVVYVSPALVGAITFGLAFLIHLYGTWKAFRAGITLISVSLPDVSPAWKGRKIIFVSDVHLGNVHRTKFAAKVVGKIMALKPDAVFIGGDMFDGGECGPDELVAPFKNLHAPKGIYFISGNHEFYVRNFETAFEAIRRVGIRILHNEKIEIDGVQIVGVDYRDVHKKEDFAAVLAKIGVDRAKVSILLKHEPDNLPVAEAAGISLGFFGHTHQGQIFPLNLITKQMYNGFDYGLKQHGAMKVYTSSGVGTWGPPLRLGTKSEIVLVEFV